LDSQTTAQLQFNTIKMQYTKEEPSQRSIY